MRPQAPPIRTGLGLQSFKVFVAGGITAVPPRQPSFDQLSVERFPAHGDPRHGSAEDQIARELFGPTAKVLPSLGAVYPE
jgi:hypothetical protein